jgi:hypothetical protein
MKGGCQMKADAGRGRVLLLVAFLAAAAGCAAGGCAGMGGARGKTPKCELMVFGHGQVNNNNHIVVWISGILPDRLDPAALNVDSVSVADASGRVLEWTQSVLSETKMGPVLDIRTNVTDAAEPVQMKAALTYKGQPYVLESRFKRYPKRGPDSWVEASGYLRPVVGEQQPQGKRGLVPSAAAGGD